MKHPDVALGSEQAAAAQRLLHSSEHPLVHSFPNGVVFVFDHDLRYLSAGGQGLAELGLSRASLEGRTLDEVFPPELLALVKPLYRRALAGESTTFDVPHAGRVFTQSLSPVRDDQDAGRVLAGMGFTQDVTQEREAERQLRESEQRFRLGFEHAPIGMAVVGLDGLFREVNPALCRLTGYPADELLALTFQDITHPDDLDADLAQLGQLVSGEIVSYSMEKRYYKADGDLVWVLLTVSLVLADDGAPLYFVSQMQDITEVKTREGAVAEAHALRAAVLEHAATHDHLTGLPNRRLVEQRLSALLVAGERRARSQGVAVLFCDLDGFKAVNDQHGHDAGDDVLRETAERLTAGVRSGDTVGRLGGDEFVVLMTTREGEDAQAATAVVAERLCASFAVPFSAARQAEPITVSIGIALPGNGADAVGLLRDADAAMYMAKRAGKNSYTFSPRPADLPQG